MSVFKKGSNVAYGINNALQNLAPQTIIAKRNPTTSDFAEIGQVWANVETGTLYQLARIANNSATWTTTPASGSTTLASLTITTGDLDFDAGATGNINMPSGDITMTSGSATIGGDLTVGGVATFNGDIDITTTSAFDITATGDQDPAILLQTNGGTSETIQITNSQGTAVDSIDLNSAAGGILLETVASTSGDAINLVANAGGISLDAGTTAAITANAAAGDAIALDATAGGFTIGGILDSSVSVSGASVDLTLASVGGSVNIGASEADLEAILIEASDIAGGIGINAGTGGLVFDLVNGAFDLETGTGAINIGADAAAHTITVGNITGATAVVANTGTGGFQVNTTGAGDIDLNSADDVTIDATGLISLDAAEASNFTVSGAALDLTLESTAGSVNINGGEAVGDAIAIDASAGGFTLDGVLTSGITVTGASEDLNLTATGGSINVSASEAAADAVVIEASNAAGGVQINANGLVAVAPDAASVASPTASSTQNFRVIQATFTGFTTASSSSQDFTIASDQILATSACLVQVTNLNASTNDAIMTMDGVTQAAGSLVVHTTNNGAGALGAGDNILITVWVLN